MCSALILAMVPPRYARPARLSVSHLYNLRRQAGYHATRLRWTKTRGHAIPIGERPSEAYLMPVLTALLDGFPGVLLGFHADNGSEYINHTVAELLDTLRIEFTKSCPRDSNDNALAETKNGAIVRKHWAMRISRSALPPPSTPSAKTFSTPT